MTHDDRLLALEHEVKELREEVAKLREVVVESNANTKAVGDLLEKHDTWLKEHEVEISGDKDHVGLRASVNKLLEARKHVWAAIGIIAAAIGTFFAEWGAKFFSGEK